MRCTYAEELCGRLSLISRGLQYIGHFTMVILTPFFHWRQVFCMAISGKCLYKVHVRKVRDMAL